MNKLLEEDLFKTPKPERLLKQIIEISTNEGDTVLDFFSGSGTTAAVALKLKRKFIAIEQMDYIETVTKLRLKKVVEGEQGGISKAVNWSGGSSFIYCELAKANQLFVDAIEEVTSKKDIENLLHLIIEKGFLKYTIAVDELRDRHFQQLSLEEQQQILIGILDKNMLYVPLAEIEDETYQISRIVKDLNNQFYSK